MIDSIRGNYEKVKSMKMKPLIVKNQIKLYLETILSIIYNLDRQTCLL